MHEIDFVNEGIVKWESQSTKDFNFEVWTQFSTNSFLSLTKLKENGGGLWTMKKKRKTEEGLCFFHGLSFCLLLSCFFANTIAGLICQQYQLQAFKKI